MRISVITPSVRKNGLGIVRKSLEAQEFKDFEWIVCSPFDLPKKFSKVNFKWIEDEAELGYWGLNRSYNQLFDEAAGELIISLQDWVYVKPDGLQKFWDNYKKIGPRVLISGVGDQYERLGKFNKPEIKIWSDPRKTEKYGSFYELGSFDDIEFNWCSFPMQAIIDSGGLDNGLDFLGFGGDTYQMVDRLNDLGTYKFYIDQSNESFTIRHDRSDFNGQKYWDENHILLNGKYNERKLKLIESDNWPVLKNNGENIK